MKYQPFQTVFAHTTNMGVLHAMMRSLESQRDAPDYVVPPATIHGFHA